MLHGWSVFRWIKQFWSFKKNTFSYSALFEFLVMQIWNFCSALALFHLLWINYRVQLVPSQEKFQNPHFGFKKGNNWDFKGIFLGKPKIGKVLPKPSMGFLNPMLSPIMGFFSPKFYPRVGYFWASLFPVLGLKLPILFPKMGFLGPKFYPTVGYFCASFFPVLGLKRPILSPIMGFLGPKFYPIMGYFWAWFFPRLGLKFPIQSPTSLE